MPGILGSGGGGGTQYSEVQQTTTNLPAWAEPYYNDVLARAGYESSTPYQPYQGQRLAYFSPMEQQALAGFGALGVSGTPAELDYAGQVAAGLTQGWDTGINTSPVVSGYTPGYLGGADYTAGALSGADYTAGGLGFNYNPTTRESGYTAGGIDFNPYIATQRDATSRDATSRDMGFTAGSLATPGVLDAYMDPYYQNVVDIEKEQAARQTDIRIAAGGLDAAGMGSLGGYREAILQAEEERNLAYQMGEIQAIGSQDAYAQALASFEADRAARAQEEQFGQSQFNLNEGFGQSQFNLNEGFAQSQWGMNEQSRQRMSELIQNGFSITEAAKQAQEELTQSQYGLNQQALQESESLYQNQYSLEQSAQQIQAELGISRYEAVQLAQQMQSQLAIAQYQASEDAKQEAAALGLSARDIEQAGQIAAANVMLGQDQNQLNAAGMLGDFALQRQDMEMSRLSAMNQAGLAERNLMQQGLDTGYQDFLDQRNWGWDQLGRLSNIMQGVPVQSGQTQTSTLPGASTMQQLIGGGIGGINLYNMYNQGG